MGKGIALFIGLILYLTFVGAFLVFCYGLVVIVFRNVFGIELPDPVSLGHTVFSFRPPSTQ
jgi:hypothetical protein